MGQNSPKHIICNPDSIAEIVIMVGDPLRAEHIAEEFLEDPVQYNWTRNAFGFTGFYNGKRISVQGAGMGMGSWRIYVHELFKFYPNPKILIRMGTCGACDERIQLRDLVIPMRSFSDNTIIQLTNNKDFSKIPDGPLFVKAKKAAKELKLNYYCGPIIATDYFYPEPGHENDPEIWMRHNIIAVEMESYALFKLAKHYKKKALTLLTVSDSLHREEELSSKDRETCSRNMFNVAMVALGD